jgi:hypothetical protein
MKKAIITVLLTIMLVGALAAFTACGGGGDGDGEENDGGVRTYTFEAEGIDFSGLSGFGYSYNASETDMILGKHSNSIPANVKNSLSNGYFIGYLNTPETTLTFEIMADKASEGNTLILRLGSEYGTLNLTPSALEVKVNGVALEYGAVSVLGKSMNGLDDYEGYTVPFNDYALSAKFALNAGKNVVAFTTKSNSMGIAGSLFESVGPGVDCIKIKSESALSWESLWEENKLQAELE